MDDNKPERPQKIEIKLSGDISLGLGWVALAIILAAEILKGNVK